MAAIELRNLSKNFGDVPAVRGIDLAIGDGEFIVLVGPSGCGKTTTLRMIAGLESVSGGSIAFDGEEVNRLPPKGRDIAMVFQSYALYPHMTVFSNMAFGLKLSGVDRAQIGERVRAAAELLNISELLRRRPRELSGGQRQRVAMGRAIVRQPRAFLFDEPLSNLDANLRAQMRVEIKRLHGQLRTTVVYVTHDQVEAMTLADRIVVMRDGEIIQSGPPEEVYQTPVDRFVAGFIGAPKMNFLPSRLVQENGSLSLPVGDGGAEIRTARLRSPRGYRREGRRDRAPAGAPRDADTGGSRRAGAELPLPGGGGRAPRRGDPRLHHHRGSGGRRALRPGPAPAPRGSAHRGGRHRRSSTSSTPRAAASSAADPPSAHLPGIVRRGTYEHRAGIGTGHFLYRVHRAMPDSRSRSRTPTGESGRRRTARVRRAPDSESRIVHEGDSERAFASVPEASDTISSPMVDDCIESQLPGAKYLPPVVDTLYLAPWYGSALTMHSSRYAG